MAPTTEENARESPRPPPGRSAGTAPVEESQPRCRAERAVLAGRTRPPRRLDSRGGHSRSAGTRYRRSRRPRLRHDDDGTTGARNDGHDDGGGHATMPPRYRAAASLTRRLDHGVRQRAASSAAPLTPTATDWPRSPNDLRSGWPHPSDTWSIAHGKPCCEPSVIPLGAPLYQWLLAHLFFSTGNGRLVCG